MLRFIEYTAAIWILLFFAVQVLVPTIMRQPIFPLFRRSAKDTQIKEARIELEEQAKEIELIEIRRIHELRESQIHPETSFQQSETEEDAEPEQDTAHEENH